jgi:predicted metal-binding membrane protein
VSSTRPPDGADLPLQRLLSRPVLIAGAALAGGTALAWGWLLTRSMAPGAGMEGMAAMPGMASMVDPLSAGYLLPAFAMWALMMVAMMLPSAAPMILLHARLDRGNDAQRARDSLLFVLCYLAVWNAFSALAALTQAALIDVGLLSAASLTLGDRVLVAALLLIAAVWQLTPARSACLAQCQSPLQFVLRYWQPGAAGAVRLGLRHGLFCLGCCWGLMLLLFVGGVMNLAWVALLAAVVFAEKLAPPRWRIGRWLAVSLAAAAVAVLLA